MASRSARTSRQHRTVRPPARPVADNRESLVRRVADLEDRMRILEARIRRTVAALKEAGGPKKPLEILGHKEQPRCPGCGLEVPKKHRRSDECVWCGFRFDVVPPRVLSSKRKEARGR